MQVVKKRLAITLTLFTMMNASMLFSQTPIDLKLLINMKLNEGLSLLKGWGVEVELSKEYDDLYVAYREGFQMEVKNGIITTIWIEFTYRRGGAYPLQFDETIKPDTHYQHVINSYGKPHESELILNPIDGLPKGWMKWKYEKYHLHCEVYLGDVVMTTIWIPAK